MILISYLNPLESFYLDFSQSTPTDTQMPPMKLSF